MLSLNNLIVIISILSLSCKTNSESTTASQEAAQPSSRAETPYWQKIRDFYRTGVVATFDGERGLKISNIKFDKDGTRPIVVIVSGMSENYRKFAELIYEFDQAGYAVYSMDQRGMGSSGREIGNSQLIHIINVNDYHKDLSKYMHEILPKDGRPRYLFSHSTGGFLASNFIAANPGVFSKMILSSPLFSIKITGPIFVTNLILWSRIRLGLGEQAARGTDKHDTAAEKFADNNTTHDRDRFDEYVRVQLEHPEVVMSEPTNDWVYKVEEVLTPEWLEATARAIKIPVLLFQAGIDEYVNNEPQDQFCNITAKCQKILYPTAFHELYREVDRVRIPHFQEITKFLKD